MEQVDDGNWRAFLDSPLSVLLVAGTDCPHCRQWKESLEGEGFREGVRVGVVTVDGEGVEEFRKLNAPWLAQVQGVPFTAIFANGTPQDSFYGEDLEKLKELVAGLSPSD